MTDEVPTNTIYFSFANIQGPDGPELPELGKTWQQDTTVMILCHGRCGIDSSISHGSSVSKHPACCLIRHEACRIGRKAPQQRHIKSFEKCPHSRATIHLQTMESECRFSCMTCTLESGRQSQVQAASQHMAWSTQLPAEVCNCFRWCWSRAQMHVRKRCAIMHTRLLTDQFSKGPATPGGRSPTCRGRWGGRSRQPGCGS